MTFVICLGGVCIPAHMLLAALVGLLHSYGLLKWVKTEWVTYRYWHNRWQTWREGTGQGHDAAQQAPSPSGAAIQQGDGVVKRPGKDDGVELIQRKEALMWEHHISHHHGLVHSARARTGDTHATATPLDDFIAARQEVVSMPFLMWLADRQAQAEGDAKQSLEAICKRLVVARDLQDHDRFQELHHNTLALLAGPDAAAAQPALPATSTSGTPASRDDGSPQALVALHDPVQYAVQLAEVVTGQPVALAGYSPEYDALLAVAPPAALSPEGLALAHEQANELSGDLRARRKRSVAAILGRVRVSPEQADQLLAGSAAARILDLLLALPTAEERAALLPDCFTPPAEGGGEEAASASPADRIADEQPESDALEPETEQLWCTPTQLLNEIEARLRAGQRDNGPQQARQLLAAPAGSGPQLTGVALEGALRQLKGHVMDAWLSGLPGTVGSSGDEQDD